MAEGPNRFEIEGRWDKAWKLAHYLRGIGVDAETVAGYSPDQWELVASLVRLKKAPSEKCQGIVIGLLTPTPALKKAGT